MDNRYKWFFTFDVAVFNSLTIEEGHPDLWFIAKRPGAILVSAALVDEYKFSDFFNLADQEKAVVHSISLPRCRLSRIFRRCEQNLITHSSTRIPAFEYKEELSGLTKFCFAYMDKTIITPDSRFYREFDND